MKTRATRFPLSSFEENDVKKVMRGFTIKSMRPPTVIDPPFETPEYPKYVDYQQEFEEAIGQCFGDSAITFPAPLIRRISSALSISNDLQEAHDNVIMHVNNFASKIPSTVLTLNSAAEIGRFWKITQKKIDLIIMAFAPLCSQSTNLETIQDAFHSALHQSFCENMNAFMHAANIIVDYYNSGRCGTVLLSKKPFNFMSETGLFDDHFMPLLINSVKAAIEPRIDAVMDQGVAAYLVTAQEISDREAALAESLLPPQEKKMLTSEVNNTIFSTRLETFVNGGLKDIVDSSDASSIAICAKLSSATGTSTSFMSSLAKVFENEVSKCFTRDRPMRAILRLYDALAQFIAAAFGSNSARTLLNAFERGMKVDEDSTAKQLAAEINAIFTKDDDAVARVPSLVSLFRMLHCKDFFQTAHSLLLGRRVLTLPHDKLKADRAFCSQLTDLCGTDYAKPLSQLLGDVDSSEKLLEQFKRGGGEPGVFRPLVLARELWPAVDPTPVALPPEVQRPMDAFSVFLREQMPGRLFSWSAELTRVVLRSTVGGVQRVECGAAAALVLLSASEGPKRASNIAEETKLPAEAVESVVASLSAKKGGKLLLAQSDVSINPNARIEGGVVVLPLALPKGAAGSKDKPRADEPRRDSMIEAGIVRVLKDKKSLDRAALKEAVEELIGAAIADDAFDERLPILERRQLLKVDPSGRVHYID